MQIKINATEDDFRDMTDNAYQELRKYGKGKPLNINCMPETVAVCLLASKQDISMFTPGVQVGDILMQGFFNPENKQLLKSYKKSGKADFKKISANQRPQCAEILLNQIIYKRSVCKFSWGWSWKKLIDIIDRGNIAKIHGKFPGGAHYVAAVGYDKKDMEMIYIDTYSKHYPRSQRDWKIRRMPVAEMDRRFTKLYRWCVEFFHA